MNPKHLRTLELDKILERLARFAAFSASKELIAALQPETSLARVRALQAATSEATRLLASRPSLSVGAAKDIRPLVARAGLGAVLAPHDFMDILGTIDSGRTMHELLHRGQLVYPQLAIQAGRLHAFNGLRGHILETVNDRGEVVDSASPQLARLRLEVRGGRDRIMRRLEAMIADPNNADAIQEPIVTERNGRYVIAVKAGYRHHIRGVVHDQSESGATLFLEPLVTVEMTNDWRQSQLEEQREVERLLRILSNRVAHESKELNETVDALAVLDATFARARYGELLEATEPDLNDKGVMELIDARHPLLAGRTREVGGPAKVVPQTIRLGQDYSALIVTGPNTGGKTVALKTAGLLTLMAQCGMRIPAATGSKVAVFEQVLADIGDEQSIEQSLSTFSGHLKNIVEMLHLASGRTLMLMDELGAGTDPDEGSALARAILEYLLERGVATIATTHYSELKTFAQNHGGVENASVEFDLNSLSPTYRLRIGTPGRSNALAIASRLGLPDEIVERAREGLSPEHLQVETLLEGIHKKERVAARERNRAQREEQQLRRLRSQAAGALEEAERIRSEAQERAYADAEQELAELRRETARLAQQLDRARGDRTTVRGLQTDLNQATRQMEARRSPGAPPPAAAEAPLQIAVGQSVRVPTFNQAGQVLTLPDTRGDVEVQVGAFRVRVPAVDLRSAPKPRTDEGRTRFVPAPISSPLPSLGRPLDMRGMRADEVEPLLDRELNEAFSHGVHFVRIVHGHGNGVVRRVVRDYLARQPFVSSFEPAPPSDGGDGATVVTLAV